MTIDNLLVAQNLRNLYKYVRENGFLVSIESWNRENMQFFSRDILDQVRSRAEGWKKSLPESVVEMIETKKLWSET